MFKQKPINVIMLSVGLLMLSACQDDSVAPKHSIEPISGLWEIPGEWLTQADGSQYELGELNIAVTEAFLNLREEQGQNYIAFFSRIESADGLFPACYIVQETELRHEVANRYYVSMQSARLVPDFMIQGGIFLGEGQEIFSQEELAGESELVFVLNLQSAEDRLSARLLEVGVNDYTWEVDENSDMQVLLEQSSQVPAELFPRCPIDPLAQ